MILAAEATQNKGSVSFKSMREAYELLYGEVPEYKAVIVNSYSLWLQGGQKQKKTDSV